MKTFIRVLIVLIAIAIVFGFGYYRYAQCRANGLTQAYCLAEN